MLASAGNVKRERINQIKEEMAQNGQDFDEAKIAENLPEQEILIQSVCETMEPKLVAEVMKICQEEQLMCGAEGEEGQAWMEKVI